MTDPSANIPELASIADLAPTADVWFVDIWGVLHNGVRPFASAVDACRNFRDAGGAVILASNSPRPRDGVIRQLAAVGVAADAYDDVVTSGDVTRQLLGAWRGRAIRHIGPDRDLPLYDGFELRRVSAGDADAAVCTGLFNDETETPADYASELETLRRRGATMICANPDVQVERGGRVIYCAGAVAAAYQAIGGDVLTAGKPHQPIYRAAMALADAARGAPTDVSRVLAIGDGVRTDIAGAAAFGIRSVFVASAVDVRTGESMSDAARRLFADVSGPPIGVMRALSW
ncbi:MAG: TIGR01459 family HAD-type hydrolase [Hyphomicrobium sp.]